MVAPKEKLIDIRHYGLVEVIISSGMKLKASKRNLKPQCKFNFLVV